MTNEERCEELREALSAVRARMNPPMQEAATYGAAGVVVAGEATTEPEADGDLEEEIQALEQALRDEGCEPD